MPNRTLVGTVVYGYAIAFDGSTQYGRRTAVATSANNNFSVMCWAKATTLTNASIFELGDRQSGGGNGIELRITSGGVFNVDFVFVANLSSGYTINTGTWYHLAYVRNAGTSQCYVNGTAQGGTSASTPGTPTTQMVIGSSYITNTATQSSKFNGAVDDVRIYDRVLSAGELLAIYNNGVNVNNPDADSTSLKMRIKAEEGTGSSLADDTGLGNTFTLTGSPSFVTGVVQTSNIAARSSSNERILLA